MLKTYKEIGFTLIELLIVMAVLAVLAVVVLAAIGNQRDKARLAIATSNLRAIATAAGSYRAFRGYYPPDENRNVPGELEQEMIAGGFSTSPWYGSVFDWDYWTDPSTHEDIVQISIRFCDFGGESCEYPSADWAKDFDYYSSVYYCLEGPCRSHISRPINHPGYCVNCP